MFPRWKPLKVVDPEREYVAFTSRFFMKSMRRVPAFFARSFRIMKQANTAPGIIGWSLGSNLFKLEFHTLSVWEDAESLRRFVREGNHQAALGEFEQDVRRKSIFVYYKVMGRDLPVMWKDAIARQEKHDRG
jgi:heme-degrading monooxygenase HmoA